MEKKTFTEVKEWLLEKFSKETATLLTLYKKLMV